jgi:hypothetical protein
MRNEYVLEEWQLPALDSFQWKSLDAPIGLAVAVRQICQSKIFDLPTMTAAQESSILQDLDQHNNMMQSAILGLRTSFEEEKEEELLEDDSNEVIASSCKDNSENEREEKIEKASSKNSGGIAELLSSLPEDKAESRSESDKDDDVMHQTDDQQDTAKDTFGSTLKQDAIENGPERTPSRTIKTSDNHLERTQYATSVSPTILLSAPSPHEEGHDSFHVQVKALFPPTPDIGIDNVIVEDSIETETMQRRDDSDETPEEDPTEDAPVGNVATDQCDEEPIPTPPGAEVNDTAAMYTVLEDPQDITSKDENKAQLKHESSIFHKAKLSMSERHSVSDVEMDDGDEDDEYIVSSASTFHHRSTSSLDSLYYVDEDENTVITSNVSPSNKANLQRRRSHEDVQIQTSSIGKGYFWNALYYGTESILSDKVLFVFTSCSRVL